MHRHDAHVELPEREQQWWDTADLCDLRGECVMVASLLLTYVASHVCTIPICVSGLSN
jgi:hypothetical protein